MAFIKTIGIAGGVVRCANIEEAKEMAFAIITVNANRPGGVLSKNTGQTLLAIQGNYQLYRRKVTQKRKRGKNELRGT